MIVRLADSSKVDIRIIQENLNDFNGSGTKFVDEITKNMKKLENNPEIGASLQTKVEIITDFRYLVFPFTKKQIYIILYRIDKKAKVVYINRVFDSRTNYLHIIFDDVVY